GVGARELGPPGQPAARRGAGARRQAGEGPHPLLRGVEARAQPDDLSGPRRPARARGRHPARPRAHRRLPRGRGRVRREAGGGIHRILRRAAAIASAAIALLAGPAAADPVTGPIDEGIREQSCKALAASTVGLPEQTGVDQPAALPPTWTPAPRALLPRRVHLRTATETFNRKYAFAVRRGEIYAQVPGGTWRRMPLPPCFDGRVSSIAADDDEMIALDGARRIFTMDNASKN